MELGEVAMLLDRIVKNCNELSERDREDLTRISTKFSMIVAARRLKSELGNNDIV